jgi:hypothetical protein
LRRPAEGPADSQRRFPAESEASTADTHKDSTVERVGMADDSSVSFWWILLFVLLTLGVAAGAVLFVGGDLFGTAGLILPI